MAITAAELSAVIDLDDRAFRSGMQRVGNDLNQFGANLTRVGAGLTAGITAPLTLLGAGVIKVGQDYERAMNIFEAVTRASGDEMARASKVAQQLGADMKLPATSAGDAAKAMTELAKGGLTATQAMDAARGTLQLAAAAMIDEARAAEITSNALNAFGLAASEAGRVSDLLAAAANASSAEIDDIALSMQQASAVFASANIPIEDLTAAIGLMANAGIKGSDAGTSLKTMIIALSAPTDKAAMEMKRLGINIFDAQGQFIPFRGMIEQVSNALKGMSDQQQASALKTIFGTDALRAANIVMADGVDKFDKMSEAVNRVGAAEELAGARAKGLSGAIDGLISQFETLGLKIFQTVSTSLEGITRQFAEFVSFLGTLPPEAMKVGLAIAAVFAAAGPVALAIGTIIALIGGPLTLAVVGITTVVAAMAAAVALNFGRITEVVSASTTKSRASLADMALAAGSVLDAFQVFARGAVIVFDVIVTGAVLMAQGVKLAFNTIKDAGAAALALASNDMVGFATAMASMATTSIDSAKAISGSMRGLAQRLAGDLRNISSHLGGEFAKSFWFAATQSGKAFGEISSAVVKAGKDIKEATDKGKKGLQELGDGAASHGKKAAKAIKDLSDEVLHFNLSLQMENMQKFLTSIGAIPKPVYEVVNALEDLKVAEKELAGVTESTNRIISNTEPYVKIAGAAQVLQSQFEQLSQTLPRAWNTIIDGFVKKGSEMGVKVKGYASDIINVFDTMPGKWGQSLNKALNEVNKWINFIDSAIKLIQRIMNVDQTGLGGIFESIAGSFKKTTAEISGTFDEMQKTAKRASQDAEESASQVGTAMKKMGTDSEEGSSAVQSAFALAGASIGAFLTGKSIGGLWGGVIGGIQGAFTGFKIGGIFGAIVGGVSGILGAVFGKKKSPTQTVSEQQQLEQLKLNVQQSAQAVVNAAIEGFDKAIAFFEKLDEFTAPRKAKFKEFFKAFTRLMDHCLELAKSWSAESLTKAKAAAEAIGPIADAIAKLPEAFDAINGHFGVAQTSIDQFFNDFDRVVTGFFTRVEAWAVGRAKHARKIANNIAPAIDLLGPLLEAIKNMSSLSRPPDEAFDILEDVLETIVMRTAALSEKFDKALLKTMANFAEKSGGALSLFSEAVGSLKAMVELKMPTEQDFANVFTGIERVIDGMIDVASRLTTEGLGRAEGMAQASLTLFASLKAGVEALSALKDFAGVLPEVFDKFFTDFNHAIDLVTAMATRAIAFDNASKSFKDYITSGAAHLATAFTMLSQIMNAAGSFFPGGTPATIASVPALASGGDIASSGLAYLHAGERVVPASVVQSGSSGAVNLTVHINAGTVVHESQLPDLIVKALVQAQKMGKVNGSFLTGSIQFAR